MRRWTLPSIALTLFVLAALPGAAQQPAASPLAGTWQHAGPVEQAQATVQQAIEPVVLGVTPDLQQFARARIAESTWVPQTIVIQPTPERISVQLSGQEQRTFETAPNQPQNVYSRSGVRAQLVQRYRPDGGIEQIFTAVDGVQSNVLVPVAGTRMHLDVTMTAPRWPRPIQFRLQYTRR